MASHLDERNIGVSSGWGCSCFVDVTKNYRTLCFKSFQFWRRQSRNYWKTSKQCGNASARGIFIMEAVLEHPEKTLSEIVYTEFAQTGSEFPLASIFYYLQRNHFSQKKVCLIFSSALEISYSFWNKQAAAFFFPNQLNKIALQRSEEARIIFHSNVCALDSEMFVFIGWERVCKYQ